MLKNEPEIWQLDRGGLAIHQRLGWWTLAQGIPLEHQKSEGCKIFVTLFSYTVWSSAMKFGMVMGMANGHVPRIWRTLVGGPVIPCGDMHQSFTDALTVNKFSGPLSTYFPNFTRIHPQFFRAILLTNKHRNRQTNTGHNITSAKMKRRQHT